MASQQPLAIALSVIPSLPRPLLSRLVTRAIEHLDDLDGDPDLEDGDEDEAVEDGPLGFDPEEDMCPAGDDWIHGGGSPGSGGHYDTGAGDPEDAERETWSHPDDHPAELFRGRRSRKD